MNASTRLDWMARQSKPCLDFRLPSRFDLSTPDISYARAAPRGALLTPDGASNGVVASCQIDSSTPSPVKASPARLQLSTTRAHESLDPRWRMKNLQSLAASCRRAACHAARHCLPDRFGRIPMPLFIWSEAKVHSDETRCHPRRPD